MTPASLSRWGVICLLACVLPAVGAAPASGPAAAPPPGSADPRAAAVLSSREIAGRVAPSVVLVTTANDAERRQGSGFLVEHGAIVTALHVIDGAKKIVVTLSDGRSLENAGVRAYDVQKDLAVLQVEISAGGKEIATVVLGKPASLEPGDPILVVSNPLGLKQTVTEGIVSAWRESGREDDGAAGESGVRLALPACRLLQISASISPGSSGGPVVDQRGEVIGVATAGVLYGAQGLNFAVPVDELSPLLAARDVMDLETFLRRLRSTRRDLARPHFERAEIAFEQGRRSEAKRELERSIVLFPGYEEALLLSARLLEEEGDLDKALERVTVAVSENEESAEAWYRLARLYRLQARDKSSASLLGKAQSAYERALDLEPRHARAALGLAGLKAHQGLLSQAEDLLRQAVAADPRLADAHCMLGEIYLQKSMVREAEEAFKQALWAEPDHGLGHFGLARLYTGWDTSHEDLATRHWKEFLRIAADDPSLAEEREMARRLIERYFPQLVDW